MANSDSSRKKFLQLLGLSTGAALLTTADLTTKIDAAGIRMLKSEHQEFMVRYEKWMEEYMQAMRVQKANPDNPEHHKALMALSQKAEAFKPELNEYLQDETFAIVFGVTIEKMTKEIPT